QQAVGAGHDAHVFERCSLLLQGTHFLEHVIKFIVQCVKTLGEGFGAVCQGTAISAVVVSSIQIVKGNALKQAEGPAANFLGRSVIDLEVAAATPDVDSAVGEHG